MHVTSYVGMVFLQRVLICFTFFTLCQMYVMYVKYNVLKIVNFRLGVDSAAQIEQFLPREK